MISFSNLPENPLVLSLAEFYKDNNLGLDIRDILTNINLTKQLKLSVETSLVKLGKEITNLEPHYSHRFSKWAGSHRCLAVFLSIFTLGITGYVWYCGTKTAAQIKQLQLKSTSQSSLRDNLQTSITELENTSKEERLELNRLRALEYEYEMYKICSEIEKCFDEPKDADISLLNQWFQKIGERPLRMLTDMNDTPSSNKLGQKIFKAKTTLLKGIVAKLKPIKASIDAEKDKKRSKFWFDSLEKIYSKINVVTDQQFIQNLLDLQKEPIFYMQGITIPTQQNTPVKVNGTSKATLAPIKE